jgi:hypothetical protein
VAAWRGSWQDVAVSALLLLHQPRLQGTEKKKKQVLKVRLSSAPRVLVLILQWLIVGEKSLRP